MRRLSLMVGIICVVTLFGSVANAQQPAASPPAPPAPPVYGPPITTDQAKKAVAGALAEARRRRTSTLSP